MNGSDIEIVEFFPFVLSLSKHERHSRGTFHLGNLYEAELYRLKGALTLQQAGSRLQAVGFREKEEEAEECLLKAIAVARKQQAKSLELRAAMSLARL